jgi:hypothetical protein
MLENCEKKNYNGNSKFQNRDVIKFLSLFHVLNMQDNQEKWGNRGSGCSAIDSMGCGEWKIQKMTAIFEWRKLFELFEQLKPKPWSEEQWFKTKLVLWSWLEHIRAILFSQEQIRRILASRKIRKRHFKFKNIQQPLCKRKAVRI